MKKALLWEKIPGGNIRCSVCQRRCEILPGNTGYCHTRLNQNGVLYSLIYGMVSADNVDPIEKKPVYHYKPGTRCYSLGSYGCNFRCDFCQNWDISYLDVDQKLKQVKKIQPNRKLLHPEKAVELALQNKCEGIAWTYNEPTIWFEYTLACAKIAKRAGLYTVYVTNGFMTEEALDRIGPYLDVFRVDIKSMENEFYQKLIRVPNMEGILKVTERAKRQWKMHMEVVTNVIPSWNDSAENLRKTAEWILRALGKETPWHLTRFFPCAQLTDAPQTPMETLLSGYQIGIAAGLQYVFIGNVPDSDASNTYCPHCRALLIERKGSEINIKGLDEKGFCSTCKRVTNVVL